jgi:hypothetical protein
MKTKSNEQNQQPKKRNWPIKNIVHPKAMEWIMQENGTDPAWWVTGWINSSGDVYRITQLAYNEDVSEHTASCPLSICWTMRN